MKCIKRKLVLENLNLGVNFAEELKNILNNTTAISELRLNNNKLGNKGVKHLADFFKSKAVEIKSDEFNIEREDETGFIKKN